MTPQIKTLLILLVILTACAGNKQPQITGLPDDAVILAFGDSLTYGTGASREQSYPSVLAEMTSLQVINSGVPGEISSDGLARLPELLDEHQPQLLILIHGGNDMIRKIPREVTANNLREMIKAAKQRQIPVIMFGVPAPGLYLLASADVYAQVAEEQQIPIDLEVLPEILADNDLKSDLIHPNATGYRKMAEAVVQLLQDTGALQKISENKT